MSKIAVFDLDDTVFNLHDYLLPYLNAYAGTDHKEIVDYNWEVMFGVDVAKAREIIKESNAFLRIDFRHPNVRYWFQAIRNKGWKIWFITARGRQDPDVARVTKEALINAAIRYDKLIITEMNEMKADYFTPEVALYFDDSPRQVEYAHQKGFNAYLIDQPWNRSSQHPKVCKTIADVQLKCQWGK